MTEVARALTTEELVDLIIEQRIKRAPSLLAEMVERHEGHIQTYARHLIPDPSLAGEWARFAAWGAMRAVDVLRSHEAQPNEVLTCNALRSLWAYVAMGLRGSKSALAADALARRSLQGDLDDE